MNNLQKKFREKIVPELMKEFGHKNPMSVAKPEKVSINAGLSKAVNNPHFTEDVFNDLKLIAGQAPVKTKAKKAISGFKIRENQEVGVAVTLRGKRMWDFIERLTQAAIPRIRDFRGIDLSNFDKQGNFSYGIKEQIVFPEISHDDVNTIFGFQVNVKTTTADQEESIKLFRLLGFPIKEDSK